MDITAIIALFTALKALGFDMVLILSLVVIALLACIIAAVVAAYASWKFASFFKNDLKQTLEKLTTGMHDLTNTVSTMTNQLVDGGKRFQNLETRTTSLETDNKKIKSHLGIP